MPKKQSIRLLVQAQFGLKEDEGLDKIILIQLLFHLIFMIHD